MQQRLTLTLNRDMYLAMREHLDKLRILSLLPSATEIVGSLGLAKYLVGITHECDLCPGTRGMTRVLESGVERVTFSKIDPSVLTQGEIDATVRSSIASDVSLYSFNEEAIRRLRPTVILTQALCSVCAPDAAQVAAVCDNLGDALADELGNKPKVVSLSPNNLTAVGESILTIAEACGIPESGKKLKQEFESRLNQLEEAIESSASTRPNVLFLEWLDPPFDGGHWVPEQIRIAGGECISNRAGSKSAQISWEEIGNLDPDVILVGCCGLDLQRNIGDAKAWFEDHLDSAFVLGLRAIRNNQVYALDGNRFFARPSPSLLGGVLAMSHCIHEGNGALISQIQTIESGVQKGDGWAKVQLDRRNVKAEFGITVDSDSDQNSVWSVHALADARGENSYIDPVTGFQVFTKACLLAKGRCCGAGCRHCPYAHMNVLNKESTIKQPAPLYVRKRLEKSKPGSHSVLFWSGGKDSFLAMREWMRQGYQRGLSKDEILDRLVLLTTFDGTTRVVAHQEIPVSDITRQAKALNLTLVGIPLYPQLKYEDAIKAGLNVIKNQGFEIDELIFGDLHLDHIKRWREQELGRFAISLSFPIWNLPYENLLKDLEASRVACTISACRTIQEKSESKKDLPVAVGELFTRDLFERLIAAGWDAFGENGEFHTLARVWESNALCFPHAN